jgi:hypothetical protein
VPSAAAVCQLRILYPVYIIGAIIITPAISTATDKTRHNKNNFFYFIFTLYTNSRIFGEIILKNCFCYINNFKKFKLLMKKILTANNFAGDPFLPNLKAGPGGGSLQTMKLQVGHIKTFVSLLGIYFKKRIICF